eukprot:3212617-Karenia_brevis.AAC.1
MAGATNMKTTGAKEYWRCMAGAIIFENVEHVLSIGIFVKDVNELVWAIIVVVNIPSEMAALKLSNWHLSMGARGVS